MGRTAAGVRGIRLRKGDSVVDLAVVRKGATLLTVCENGHGKRTEFSEYSTQRRGGQGVIDIKTSARNGAVVAMRETFEPEQLILVTEQGKTVRIPAASVRCIGRNTQGVRLITTDADDRVSSVAAIVPDDDEPEAEPEAEAAEETEAQDAGS
jgi:DNA gyrase subunit A